MTETHPLPRMLQDILDQPRSLTEVARYQFGPGQDALHRAARMMASARSIVFAGMGSSLFASLPLVRSLKRAGLTAAALDASELLHFMADYPEVSDVVVLVSRSGESAEITHLMPALRARNIRIIGLTNEPGSTLAGACDQHILIGSLADEMVAVQSYTGTLLALALLGMAVLRQIEPKTATEIEAGIRSLEEALPGYRESSRAWGPLFSGTSAIYLLTRGGSLAAAREGALLLHEVAKLPALAMDAGQFRHGPVEVVDSHFTALIFCSPGAGQNLNHTLGLDLARLGGRIALIGPGDYSGAGELVHGWALPEVAAFLLPIAEIIPVQFASLRLAQEQGIIPGKFRYVRQVTTSEQGFPAD